MTSLAVATDSAQRPHALSPIFFEGVGHTASAEGPQPSRHYVHHSAERRGCAHGASVARTSVRRLHG